MKKAIIVMVFVSVILTIAAVIDEFMIQDMKRVQSRFTSHHPMQINTYKKGQCTYYVFERVKNDGNKINNTWSDAKHWDKKAIDDGYIVDRNPKKGSILQSSKGKYGHVAYIETINEDGSIQVSEMNYTKPYEITKRTIHTYDIKNYYYIHPQKIKT